MIGVGLAGLLLVLFILCYGYRRWYIPWRKKRHYQEILEQSERRDAAAAAGAAAAAPPLGDGRV